MNLQKIIRDCKKENKTAQKKLFDALSGRAVSLCTRYSKNTDDAQDIMIEGFYKVFENISKYDNQKDFSKWFNTIIINTAINHYKKESKHYFTSNIEDVDESRISVDEAEEIESQITKKDILNAIKLLPDGQREIFNLYSVEGYSHDEISEIVGIKESTVRTQYMRAKKKLKENLLQLIKNKNGEK